MADLLVEYGLIDLVRHFRERRSFRNLKTWSQFQQDIVLRSICDYILGHDRRRFKLIGTRNMRNFSSDHFALRAQLLRRHIRCHAQYLRGRQVLLLRIPPAEELTRAEAKFQTFKALELVLPKLKLPPRPLWMSPDSIRLTDKISALRRNPATVEM